MKLRVDEGTGLNHVDCILRQQVTMDKLICIMWHTPPKNPSTRRFFLSAEQKRTTEEKIFHSDIVRDKGI